MSGDMTLVLSNAGHIASLVNPPGNPKAHFFVGGDPGPDPQAWRAQAKQVSGTWWDHWAQWITARSGQQLPAPTTLGSPAHPVLQAAPGSYVRELVGQRSARATMGVRIVPMDSTSTSTSSPGPSSRGGLKLMPTPPGVPVAMTSPALRVTVSVM
jgi:hypothetical protein